MMYGDKIESNKLNVKSKDEIEKRIVEGVAGQEKSSVNDDYYLQVAA